MASAAIVAGTELLIGIIQTYTIAAKQAGLSAEQSKAFFLANVDRFMEISSKPVEPVKEGNDGTANPSTV